MPSINLRLTDQQHQQLQAAAKYNRRSIQKEIVARLSLTPGETAAPTVAPTDPNGSVVETFGVHVSAPPAVNDPYRP